MANNTFVEQLLANLGVGPTTFSSFTTAKSVIPATSLRTIGANEMYIGKMYRLNVWGAVSNIVTTPGTLTFQLMIGSAIAWSSGALQMDNVAGTLLPFHLEVFLVCRAIGTGTNANLIGMGDITSETFVTTAGGVATATQEVLQTPVTTPAVGGGFDSTIANVADFWAGFSISNAANSIRVEMISLEALN